MQAWLGGLSLKVDSVHRSWPNCTPRHNVSSKGNVDQEKEIYKHWIAHAGQPKRQIDVAPDGIPDSCSIQVWVPINRNPSFFIPSGFSRKQKSSSSISDAEKCLLTLYWILYYTDNFRQEWGHKLSHQAMRLWELAQRFTHPRCHLHSHWSNLPSSCGQRIRRLLGRKEGVFNKVDINILEEQQKAPHLTWGRSAEGCVQSSHERGNIVSLTPFVQESKPEECETVASRSLCFWPNFISQPLQTPQGPSTVHLSSCSQNRNWGRGLYWCQTHPPFLFPRTGTDIIGHSSPDLT